MQFIFGDSKSSYEVLYTDGNSKEALNIVNRLQLSYDPSCGYDAYGYKQMSGKTLHVLYFRFFKDRGLTRNVYCLHGFDHEVGDHYYSVGNYIDDLFLKYAGQDEIDQLRKSPNAFSFDLEVDHELASTSISDIEVNNNSFKYLIGKLWQKKKPITVVVDDDNYSNNYVRVLIKKIFAYLPPSLRQWCGWLSGVAADDSSVDVYPLHIIPQSMHLKNTSNLVYINQETELPSDYSNVKDEIDKLMLMDDYDSEALYEDFEGLFDGWNNGYNKDDFIRFIHSYFSRNTSDIFEIILKGIERCTVREPILPEFMKKSCSSIINKKSVFETLINHQNSIVYNPDGFFECNKSLIRLLYNLSDDSKKILSELITDTYNNIIVCEQNYNDLHQIPSSELGDSQLVSEQFFAKKIKEGRMIIANRLDKYSTKKTYIVHLISEEIDKSPDIYLNIDASVAIKKVRGAVEMLCDYDNFSQDKENFDMSEVFADTVSMEIDRQKRRKKLNQEMREREIREKIEKECRSKVEAKIRSNYQQIAGYIEIVQEAAINKNANVFSTIITESNINHFAMTDILADLLLSYVCSYLGSDSDFVDEARCIDDLFAKLLLENSEERGEIIDSFLEKLYILKPRAGIIYQLKYGTKITSCVKNVFESTTTRKYLSNTKPSDIAVICKNIKKAAKERSLPVSKPDVMCAIDVVNNFKMTADKKLSTGLDKIVCIFSELLREWLNVNPDTNISKTEKKRSRT